MSKIRFPIFKLKFSGALHISDVRLDYGTTEKHYHSDALAAALLAINAKWGEYLPDEGHLPCTISSLFPYSEKGGYSTYFLPKPMTRLKINDQEKIVKDIKKLQWVDTYYFERMAHNEDLGSVESHIEGTYLRREAGLGHLMTFQTLPRVQVPRNESSVTQIFYMQMIRFAEEAGLYFLATGDEPGLDWLRSSLHKLGLEGIGTDRNVGNGHFTYSEDTIELDLPDQADAMTNLGLFCPENYEQLQDMMHLKGNTDLIKRGGWITSEEGLGIRKKPIYFFREGSVFQNKIADLSSPIIKGIRAIDLSPDTLPAGRSLPHKVYRNGQSLFFPLKLAL